MIHFHSFSVHARVLHKLIHIIANLFTYWNIPLTSTYTANATGFFYNFFSCANFTITDLSFVYCFWCEMRKLLFMCHMRWVIIAIMLLNKHYVLLSRKPRDINGLQKRLFENIVCLLHEK